MSVTSSMFSPLGGTPPRSRSPVHGTLTILGTRIVSLDAAASASDTTLDRPER